MNLRLIALFTFCLALVGVKSEAQHNLTMHYMSSVPQVIKINPAVIPDSRWYIGIPAISSIGASVSNSGFDFTDLIAPKPDGGKILQVGYVLDTVMGDVTYVDVMTDIEILSLLVSELKKCIFLPASQTALLPDLHCQETFCLSYGKVTAAKNTLARLQIFQA